jgi:multiple sugar transport system permease protein
MSATTVSATAIRTRPARKPLTWRRVLLYVLLSIGSLIMAYPLLFGMAASLATQAEFSKATWIVVSNPPTANNYVKVFTTADKVPIWIFNTLIRVVWYIVIPSIVAVLAGYVFARLRFRGRNTLFILLLTSMMVPNIVYYVPSFIMMARWPLAGGNNILGQGGTGFVNQWPALLILGLLNVYYIFLMRQTFYSIPRDFEEAARVDGANTWQILTRVYLPMLAPSLAVLFIFQTIAIWNDYVWPLMSVGGEVNMWPTALGFQRLMLSGTRLAGSPAISDFPWALTVAVIATLPLILMFVFLQRYFVEGVQGFALKG